MREELNPRSEGWKRPVWILLLVAASVVFMFGFHCAAPFAAFAVMAACTLPRRDAYALSGAVWLANQAVGFGFLHYPLTMNCVAWGAALGVTAMVSTLAARFASRPLVSLPTTTQISVGFLAAFAAYELTLIIFSLMLGGLEHYTLMIQGRIFGFNVTALFGLLVLERLGVAVGVAPSFGYSSSAAPHPA